MKKSQQKGEMPVHHILMLALVAIPLILGLIYFSMSAMDKTNAEARGLKTQEGKVDRAITNLKNKW